MVLPPVTETRPDGSHVTRPVEQLHRTPYMAAFQAGWFRFMLLPMWVELEVDFGDRHLELVAAR